MEKNTEDWQKIKARRMLLIGDIVFMLFLYFYMLTVFTPEIRILIIIAFQAILVLSIGVRYGSIKYSKFKKSKTAENMKLSEQLDLFIKDSRFSFIEKVDTMQPYYKNVIAKLIEYDDSLFEIRDFCFHIKKIEHNSLIFQEYKKVKKFLEICELLLEGKALDITEYDTDKLRKLATAGMIYKIEDIENSKKTYKVKSSELLMEIYIEIDYKCKNFNYLIYRHEPSINNDNSININDSNIYNQGTIGSLIKKD